MIEFIDFLRSRMSTVLDSEIVKGSTIDEMSVKPTGVALTDFYNKLVEQKRINNINEWKLMSDTELDDFGAKFFIKRIEGNLASTNIRIRFNSRENIEITYDIVASTSDGVSFIPSKSVDISKNSIQISKDAYSLYYIDVNFTSVAEGDIYNVKKNTITKLDNAKFNYVSISNIDDILNGSKRETNEEYYNRIMFTLSDRGLSTKSGIYAYLKNEYPSISNVYISGSGDKYMTRDFVSVTDENSKNSLLEFKGKTTGDNSVKHYATSYIFPPRPNTNIGVKWGPHSARSSHKFPLTIKPTSFNAFVDKDTDAAYLGYDIQNEFTTDMYTGIYFNDYSHTTTVKTESILEPPISPSNTAPAGWVVGTNGDNSGVFSGLKDGVKPSDVLEFNYGNISISGGSRKTVTVGTKTGKRTDVKVTCTIKVPSSKESLINSNINIIAAGTDSVLVDSFNGVGVGIMLVKNYADLTTDQDDFNAVMYYTHSNSFIGNDVYVTPSSDTSLSYTSMNSVRERKIRFDEKSEYNVEYILKGDLTSSFMIEKASDGTMGEVLTLIKGDLGVLDGAKDGILSNSEKYYGTTIKISVTPGTSKKTDVWEIGNFKAYDINPGTPTTMYEFDVTDINTDAELSLRAYGRGYLSGGVTEGFTSYIWNPESTGSSFGAWEILNGVSDAAGEKDTTGGLLTHTISSMDKYKVDSKIYILIVATGYSHAASLFSGDYSGNIQSVLRVDYIKLVGNSENKYHSKNKADIYVVTLRNSDLKSTAVNGVDYINGFAELSEANGFTMPIKKVDRVSVNTGTSYESTLSESEFSVYYEDESLRGSSKEVARIVLNTSFTPSSITVEYTPFPDIKRIQSSFNSNKQVYGDMLVKHSYAVNLSMDIKYSGKIVEEEFINLVWKYFDDNGIKTVSKSELVRYLYSNELVSYVEEPLSITYRRTLSNIDDVTGIVENSYTIRDIEYFSVDDLTVSRV